MSDTKYRNYISVHIQICIDHWLDTFLDRCPIQVQFVDEEWASWFDPSIYSRRDSGMNFIDIMLSYRGCYVQYCNCTQDQHNEALEEVQLHGI